MKHGTTLNLCWNDFNYLQVKINFMDVLFWRAGEVE